MYLLPTIYNFLMLFTLQIIFIKFFKIKNNWHIITFIFYCLITLVFKDENYSFFQSIEYFIFNLAILMSYIIFLALVFNDSPSLFYLNDSNKDRFINKGFIKHRLKLMKKYGLINNNEEITNKGIFILKFSIFLSNVFLKEND